MMLVTITGIRDLHPASEPDVELAIADLFAMGAKTIRFGGALGADTVALTAAGELRPASVRLEVFVPCTLADQPAVARRAIEKYADTVIEGRLPMKPWAFLKRNDAMLTGDVELVVAFTDGREEGGTWYTMNAAKRRGITVLPVRVLGTKGATPNVRLKLDDTPGPIFAWRPYVSLRSTGKADPTSVLIRHMKAGEGGARAVSELGRKLAAYIEKEPALRRATYLVPMPRRLPGVPSDLEGLATAIAKHTHQIVLTHWLERVEAPAVAGRMRAFRMRYPAEEHARTLHVVSDGPKRPGDPGRLGPVLLLDNVIASSGTMAGAQLAVQRDTGIAPAGLAVLYSSDFKLV